MLSEGTKDLVKKYGIENLQQCISSASEQRKFDQQYLLDFVISNNEQIAETRVKTSQYREKLRIQQHLLSQLQDSIIEVQHNLEKSNTNERNNNIGLQFEQINTILQNMSSIVMKFFLEHNCRAFASYVIKNNAFSDYIHNPELFGMQINDINVLFNIFEATDDTSVKNALLVKIFTNAENHYQQIKKDEQKQDTNETNNYLVLKTNQIEPFMLDTLITILSNYTQSNIDVFSDQLFENYMQQLVWLYLDSYSGNNTSFKLDNLQIDREVILNMLYQLGDHQISLPKNQIISNQDEAEQFIRLASQGVKAFKQIFETKDLIFIQGVTSSGDLTRDTIINHYQSIDGSFLSNKTVYQAVIELETQINDQEIIDILIDKFIVNNPALQYQVKECLREKDGIVASVLQVP